MKLVQQQTRRFDTLAQTRTAHAQRRIWLAPLLAFAEAKRWTLFSEYAEQASLASSTRATYWAVLHSAAADLKKPMTPAIKAIQKRLDEAAAERLPWTLAENQFVSLEGMTKLLPLAAENPLVLAVVLSWTIGHRIGDVLKLRTENVAVDVPFPNLRGKVSRLTFVEGKTIHKIGKYSVFLSDSVPFNDAWKSHVARHASRPYLFLESEALLNKDDLAKATEAAERKLLAEVERHIGRIDLRAIRRGGLSQMSSAGSSDEEVITFSKHASPGMLQAYLRAGQFNGAVASTQAAITANQFQQLERPWNWRGQL